MIQNTILCCKKKKLKASFRLHGLFLLVLLVLVGLVGWLGSSKMGSPSVALAGLELKAIYPLAPGVLSSFS